MRITGMLMVLLMASPCICRSDSPPQQRSTPSNNLSIFSRFFSQVAELQLPTERIYLNGHQSRLRHPTLQESIGLFDGEADLLKAIAVECEEELRRIDRSSRVVTLSARLNSIDGRSDNNEVAVLLRKRNEIIASAVETLKAELGSVRFDVLATFVLDGSAKPTYFPLRLK